MKLLITLLLVVFSTQVFSQTSMVDSAKTKPVKGTVAWHLMKKKNEKTGALISLTVGSILIGSALYTLSDIPILFATEEENRRANGALVRGVVGLAGLCASVPLFISASSHKRKANILLRNEKVFLPDPSKRTGLLALGLAFRL